MSKKRIVEPDTPIGARLPKPLAAALAAVLGLSLLSTSALSVAVWHLTRQPDSVAAAPDAAPPNYDDGDSYEEPATAPLELGLGLGADGQYQQVGAADINVQLVFDYSCPHCKTFEDEHSADLLALAGRQDVSVSLHPVAFLSPDGWSATAAALLLATTQVAPDKFMAANMWLMDQQGLYLEPLEALDGLSAALEVEYPSWDEISANFAGGVTAFTQDAQQAGVSGVPTLRINGVEWDRRTPLLQAVDGG